MTDTKLTKDSRENDKVDVACRDCKRFTKHIILTDISLEGSEPMGPHGDFQWIDEFQIVQCQGCEAISFIKSHSNSEDYVHTGPGEYESLITIDVYPNPEEGRNPVEDHLLLPSNLQRIYMETLTSINSGQPVLTGIGIRAIVETVCKDKKANGKDLNSKINNIVTQGVLTKDGADILHKLRTLGNDAVHEVKPHDNVQLGLALDVIDHLLQGVYILPYHAKSTFD